MLGIASGGVLGDNARTDHDLDLIAGTGAHFVRWYPGWNGIERELGSRVFDFTEPDRVLGGIAKRGMRAIIGIGTRADGHLYDDEHVAAVGPYARAIAERYHDLAIGFEGVNEGFFTKVDPNPTAARYTDMQRAIYNAVKQSAPYALVGTGGIIGSAQHLIELYDAGCGAYFDMVIWHPYTRPLSPTESIRQGHGGYAAMRDARRVMVEHYDAHKQIWVSEFGAPTKGKQPRTEAEQASDLRDAVARFRRHAWAGPFSWFRGFDNDDEHDEGYGLYRADDTGKPALDVFRSLAEVA